ncbi:LPS export ABC transporter periplasmic protein LptC [bacterium]|nr:LPS export ABC transporter periplasmic protein LptC [bacterium]
MMGKVFIIIVTLLVITFFWAFIFFDKDQEKYLKKDLLPVVSINGFLLTETYKEKKIWEIKAALAQVFKEEAQLKEVKVKFFIEDGNFYTIKANQGSINLVTKNFTLLGKTVVTSSKNLNLQTDLLNWDSQKKLIYNSSPIKIIQDKITITGNGLKLWPAGEITEILGNVRVVIEND